MEVVVTEPSSSQRFDCVQIQPPRTNTLLEDVQSQCDIAKKRLVKYREIMKNSLQPSERETLEMCFESIDILSQNSENLKLSMKNTVPDHGSFHSLCTIAVRSLTIFIKSLNEYISIQTEGSLFRWNSSTKSMNILMREMKDSCISLASLFPIFQLFAESVKIPGQDWDEEIPLCFSFEESERKAQGLDPFWYSFDPKLQNFGRMLISTFATMTGVHSEGNIWGLSSAIKINLWNTWQENMKFTQSLHKKMTTELLQKIWNLPDKSIVKFYEKVAVLQDIHTSQLFQIPFNNTTLQLKNPPTHISIRILSSKPYSFQFLNQQNQTTLKSIHSQNSLFIYPELKSSNQSHNDGIPVIFHIHGGGFISGSSAMHESYLRNWAHHTGAIIFSIDYKLAPEYQFPVALYECQQAYQWILQEKNVGFKIGKIIVTGDSAGGNLSCGLVNLLISQHLQKEEIDKKVVDKLTLGVDSHVPIVSKLPTAVVLAYPVVDFCLTVYPSRLLYYNDPLVPFAASPLCRKAYVPENADEKNPLLSPIYTPIEILQKYPQTVLFVAEYDPLSDEGVVFGAKMKKIGNDCRVDTVKGVPHGFLSLGKFIPAAQKGVEDTAQVMKEIFK